jgi:hypothetical protein
MTKRYRTYEEAEADGWRRINRRTDRDVSGVGFVGYHYESPEGVTSDIITLTQVKNKMGRLGAFAPMIRAEQ